MKSSLLLFSFVFFRMLTFTQTDSTLQYIMDTIHPPLLFISDPMIYQNKYSHSMSDPINNYQDIDLTYSDNQYPTFDLEKIGTFCDRDWMNPEHTMDSLKKVIIQLDHELNALPLDTTFSDTSSLVLLYTYDYVFRIEANGWISRQLCVDISRYGMKTKLIPQAKGSIHSVNYYDKKYITQTDTYYYLGNCQMWTTMKYYYIRADEFKNFLDN